MTTHSFNAYGRLWSIRVNDAVLADDYAASRFHEHHMLNWINDNIPRGGLWVDAGANIGNHTLPFAMWADLVVAIEPVRVNMEMLRENVSENGFCSKVMCLELGLGKGPQFLGVSEGGNGRPSQFRLRGGANLPRVAVVALDSILPEEMPLRVLKVDVEDMELEAMAGAIRSIVTHKPEIFVEVWDQRALDRLVRTLAGVGYTLIERWNHAPTYHFSASGKYAVTYTPPVQ